MVDFDYYNTLLVQHIGDKVGATAPTITPSASYGYRDANEAEAIFAGRENLPLYARVGNPTNAKLESVVSLVEGGVGAIATSSGMGALSMVLTAYLKAGDEILCIGGFFGGTYSLVDETLRRFGITNSFCDVDDFAHLESRLQAGIKMVLMESVGNPSLRLPDLQKIANLCATYQTLLVVDNTATPLLVQPLQLGADIVIHSSTKNMSGHSAALGGIAVFRKYTPGDKLQNKKYHDIHPLLEKLGEKALMGIAKKRALRDMGMSANAFGSFLTLLGLETLALRMPRVNENLTQIVTQLHASIGHKIVIHHPSLKTDKHHDRYVQHFAQGCGPIFTIDCHTKARAYALLNQLKRVTLTANIGDNRTLALHMDSTIFREFSPEAKRFLGVNEGLIRVSVGLESPEHIVQDFLQAASYL
ncbi:aminotransferase class I/II-fold pyridoxal phosphate-dependent enzyme [Sulfurospirillum sp. 1612]|uniref:aminotransferase class I/II-fold pyridoxal phosphate-dependent enzyme n=1 Tax=Sulfurospirillum sp. 1612 TaxID=3094835 RepID=UPI002F94C4B7